MEDKIVNNRYGSVEYGTEGTSKNSAITIHPAISGNYEETVTEDMEAIYTARELDKEFLELYEKSPFYEKYGKKVLEKKDRISREDERDMYAYFKNALMKSGKYTILQVFCAIVEFFGYGDMDDHKNYKGYKHMYEDVASLDDKKAIMDLLKKDNNLKKPLKRSYRLF